MADDADFVYEHLLEEVLAGPVLALAGGVDEDLAGAVGDEHVAVLADDRLPEACLDDIERLFLLRPDEEHPDDPAAAVLDRLVRRDVALAEEVPAAVVGLALVHDDVVDVLGQLGPDRPRAVGPDDVRGDADGVVVVDLEDRRRPADQRLDLVDDLEVVVDDVALAVIVHQHQLLAVHLRRAPGVEVLPEDVEVAVHLVAGEFIDIVGPSPRVVHLCLEQGLDLVVDHPARTGIGHEAEHERRDDRKKEADDQDLRPDLHV